MKTIKTLFAILFLSTFFIACEADAVNDEVGVEEIDVIGEDAVDETSPVVGKSEDAVDETSPIVGKSEDAVDETLPTN